MGVPIIVVLISFIVQTNAQFAAEEVQSFVIQTGPGSGGFGVDGFLPALGLPLLGLLLLLGFPGGAPAPPAPAPPAPTAPTLIPPAPSTPCPACPTLPTTGCPPSTVCNPMSACPPGFTRLGSLTKCYRKVTGPFSTIFSAQKACYAAGGTLAEFTNPGEAAAVQAFAGAGTYYLGYTEFHNGATGVLTGATSDMPGPAGFFPAGSNTVVECGILDGGGGNVQDCFSAADDGICEARIDPAAVTCVCP